MTKGLAICGVERTKASKSSHGEDSISFRSLQVLCNQSKPYMGVDVADAATAVLQCAQHPRQIQRR